MSKKLILCALALFIAWGVSAQKPVRYGVMAGMNVSSITDLDSKIGFHAGAKAEIGLPQVTNGLYLDAGALLSLKGAKNGDVKFHAYYLEVPVHLGYKYELNDDFALFGNAGPYIGIGLFGKTGDIKTFSDALLKRFDFGLGLKAGFELKKKYQVAVGYDFGLLNVAQGDGDAKNGNFMFSLAYMF